MYMVTSYISSAFPTFQMSISRGTDLFVDLFYCPFVNLIHPLLYDYISIFGLIIWPAKAFEVNVHDRWAALIKSIWKAVNVNNGRRLIPSHLPDYCPVSLLNLIWHRLLNIYSFWIQDYMQPRLPARAQETCSSWRDTRNGCSHRATRSPGQAAADVPAIPRKDYLATEEPRGRALRQGRAVAKSPLWPPARWGSMYCVNV